MSKDDFWRPLGRSTFFLVILLVFFAACSKKKANDSTQKSYLQGEALELARLQEAKYFDIPLPIGYVFVDFAHGKDLSLWQDGIKKSECNNSDFFCYKGNLNLTEVRDYYLKNMEQLGWKISDFSNNKEGMIVCNKLHKHCVISIRGRQKKGEIKNYICLFVKNVFYNKAENKNDINAKQLVDINSLDNDYVWTEET